jgi:hypothetical protein
MLQTLKSRWFAASVHAGLWVLLYLAVSSLRVTSPDYQESHAVSTPPQSAAPVERLQHLFSPDVWPEPLALTNAENPFFTRHFTPPAPPPPTTRKIDVTYRGFYQTGDAPPFAVVNVSGAMVVSPIGSVIASNLFVAEATAKSLTLTNLAAQTNILSLNTKKELEVPIK